MLSTAVVPYAGFEFWTVFIFFVFAHRIANFFRSKTAVRNVVMIAFSLVAVASAMKNTNMALLLMVLSTLVYLSGRFLLEIKSQNQRLILGIISIFIIVSVLCFWKYSVIQIAVIHGLFMLIDGFSSPAPEHKHIFFIGVSYFSFKFIHFLLDCYNGKIKAIDYLTFVNYILFFPSFFSGPINRYKNFHEDITNNEPKKLFEKNTIDAVRRIVNGLFKKIVIANNLLPYTIVSLNPSDNSISSFQILLGIYTYMFYIYYDFSGYTDMAIGCGRLIGIHLPENFNKPFLKRNLQLFWANWHMSLTTWLTDYIYWPLARKIRKVGVLRKNPVTISNICIVITFMVCGLWHGDGLNFFFWGLYHGIGLSILNGYSYIEKKHFPMAWRKAINTSPYGYLISLFVTFQYVALGFFFFACDLKTQQVFLRILL